MSATRFRKRVGEAQEKIKDAMVSLESGNSFRHAELKGKYLGLKDALSIFDEVTKTDSEED
jgi:hypothetical protein